MNKIILALIFITGSLFAQTGASFKFGDVGSWWIPKVWHYGTSTYWSDSTNYQTTNKSVYVFDSLKVGKWLFAGANGAGGLYLDTSKMGQLYFDGFDLSLTNLKPSGNLDVTSSNMLNLIADSTEIRTNGIRITDNNLFDYAIDENGISGLTETQQIKLPSDTASDFNSDDAITLNRQSGKITTKSLTTAADDFYTLTLTNSLISATTKIFVNYTGGTVSTGRPTLYRATCGSGSATIILLNFDTTDPLNGTIQLDFVIFN